MHGDDVNTDDEDSDTLIFDSTISQDNEHNSFGDLDMRDNIALEDIPESSMHDSEPGDELNPIDKTSLSHRILVEGKSEFKPHYHF